MEFPQCNLSDSLDDDDSKCYESGKDGYSRGINFFITSFKTIKSILALIEKENNSVRKVLNSILIIFNLNTEQQMIRKMFAWILSSRVDSRLEGFFLYGR